MFQIITLQVSDIYAIFAAIIVAVIISSFFYVVLKRKINSVTKNIEPIVLDNTSKLQQDIQNNSIQFHNKLENLSSTIMKLPHTNEVDLLQKQVEGLLEEYRMFEFNISEKINKYNLENAEKLIRLEKILSI